MNRTNSNVDDQVKLQTDDRKVDAYRGEGDIQTLRATDNDINGAPAARVL